MAILSKLNNQPSTRKMEMDTARLMEFIFDDKIAQLDPVLAFASSNDTNSGISRIVQRILSAPMDALRHIMEIKRSISRLINNIVSTVSNLTTNLANLSTFLATTSIKTVITNVILGLIGLFCIYQGGVSGIIISIITMLYSFYLDDTCMTKWFAIIPVGLLAKNITYTPYIQTNVNLTVNTGAEDKVGQGKLDTLVSVICFFFAIMASAFVPFDRAWQDFINKCDKLPKAVNGITSMMNMFEKMFQPTISKYVEELTGWHTEELSPIPSDVEENRKKVLSLSNLETLAQLGSNSGVCLRVQMVYHEFMNLRMAYYNNRTIMAYLDTYQGAVVDLFKKAAAANPRSNSERSKPTCVLFKGTTGVGKSAMMYFITADILKHYGLLENKTPEQILNLVNSSIYARNGKQEFFDAYLNQLVTVIDDFGCMKDGPTHPNTDYEELLRMVNNFPYPLPMASLAQKANTYFTSRFVFLTSNLDTINPTSMINPEALRSRISFTFNVRIKDEYKRDPKATEGELAGIDVEKVRAKFGHKQTTDIYVIDRYDIVTGQKIGECSYYEMLDYIVRHHDSEEKFFNNKQDSILEHLEERYAQADTVAPSHFFEQATFHIDEVDRDVDSYWLTNDAVDTLVEKVIDQDLYLDSEGAVQYFLESLHYISLEHAQNCPYVNGILSGNYAMIPSSWPVVHRFLDEHNNVLKLLFAEERYFGWGPFRREIPYFEVYSKAMKKYLSAGLLKFEAMFKRVASDTGIIFLTSMLALIGTSIGMLYLFKQVSYADADDEREGRIVDMAYHIRRLNEIKNDTQLSDEEKRARVNKYFVDNKLGESGMAKQTKNTRVFEDKINEHVEHLSDIMSCNIMDDSQKQSYVDMYVEEHVTPESGVTKKDLLHRVAESGKSKKNNNIRQFESGSSKMLKNTRVAESFTSMQACEVAKVVMPNCRVVRDPITKVEVCKVFIVRGWWCVMNHHTYYKMSQIYKNEDELLVTAPGHENGTLVPMSCLHEGTRVKRGTMTTDLFLFKLPRACNQGRDMLRHMHTRAAMNDLAENTTVLLVSGGANGFVKHTGKLLKKNPVATRLVLQDRKEIVTCLTYDFDIRTDYGDCGSVYMADTNALRGKIIGFHFAGTSYGGSSAIPLIYEDFEHLVDEPCIDFPEDVKIGQVSPNLDLNGVIPIGTATPPHMSVKTKLVKTDIYDKVDKSVMAPVQLGRLLEKDGAGIRGLQKVVPTIPFIPKSELDMARQSFEAVMWKGKPSIKRVLTIMEAIDGQVPEEAAYIKGINRSTSSGYPHMLTLTNGKKDLFGYNDYVITPRGQQVVDNVKAILERIKEGKVYTQSIYVDTLKDETRTLEKVVAKKTRVFAAASVEYVILFRMYYLAFLNYIMEHRIQNEVSVGICAQSTEWNKLALYLHNMGDNIVAGDFSNYDGTLNANILYTVLDIINDWYDDGEENRLVRSLLFEDIVHSVHIAEENVYSWTHSLPSGNPGTAVLNSVYNSLACRIVYNRIMKDTHYYGQFNRYVRMNAYGDDNLLSIDSQILDRFNQLTMTESFKTIGMTYTDETKSSVVDVCKPLKACGYLKRQFRYDDRYAIWFGPLARPSINERLNWNMKNPNPDEILLQNAEGAIAEWALHDEDTFKQWSKKIQEVMLEEKNVFIPVYNQAYYLDYILSGRYSDLFPQLQFQ